MRVELLDTGTPDWCDCASVCSEAVESWSCETKEDFGRVVGNLDIVVGTGGGVRARGILIRGSK